MPGYQTVWTGKQMLAFDPFHSVAYSQRTNRWRILPKAINLGFITWTGREAIGWGGGCCGDAQRNGSAYNPATGGLRKLPPSPLGASQHALGAWTGRELILFVSRYDVDGKLRHASVATAAAYDPATNRWHRLPPLPQSGYAMGTGVWDGHELLVVGAGKAARSAYAYDPAINRWRTLASLPTPRIWGIGVWAGTRLLLLGGENRAGKPLDGLAYDPKKDRWTRLPVTPLRKLYGAVALLDRSRADRHEPRPDSCVHAVRLISGRRAGARGSPPPPASCCRSPRTRPSRAARRRVGAGAYGRRPRTSRRPSRAPDARARSSRPSSTDAEVALGRRRVRASPFLLR